MNTSEVGRPASTEHSSFYERYVALVGNGDITTVLESQLHDVMELLGGISESDAAFRYAPDKWSVKQLVGHLIDAERVFGYRSLVFARNDATPLPGFSEDDYVREASFDDRTLSSLMQEFEMVRRGHIAMFTNLPANAWTHHGTANGASVSVRALAYIMAGHERHHVGIIRSRYQQTRLSLSPRERVPRSGGRGRTDVPAK